MADIGASNWSETDADNDSASPDGAPEGMLPGGMNNTLRAVMGALKRWWNQSIPKTTAGTSTAYTLSYSVAPAALVDGMTFLVQFHTASGTSPTLNPNSLGATPLHTFQGGSWAAPASGRIPSGFVSRVTYNQSAGAFRILRPLGTAADYDVGTGANNVVQLDSNGDLPSGIGGWTTGDVKLTWKSTADTGWVLMNDGSIGDASSSATTRANADTEDLFTLLWTNVSDTYAPVSGGGRGASAAADFAAHKTITLPAALGRALAISGAGSGLTSRSLGEKLGEEEHTLTEAEMPSHVHGDAGPATTLGGSGGGSAITGSSGSADTASAGSDDPHNNMQPTLFLNAMIKL